MAKEISTVFKFETHLICKGTFSIGILKNNPYQSKYPSAFRGFSTLYRIYLMKFVKSSIRKTYNKDFSFSKINQRKPLIRVVLLQFSISVDNTSQLIITDGQLICGIFISQFAIFNLLINQLKLVRQGVRFAT